MKNVKFLVRVRVWVMVRVRVLVSVRVRVRGLIYPSEPSRERVKASHVIYNSRV